MDLESLAKNWDALGEDDPMWAILADPSRRGNRWTPEEFFETGRVHVGDYLADLDRIRPGVHRRRALDFGCGAGRLTQALADHFEVVDGVDIAPSMIRLAEDMDQKAGRVRYHLNQTDDLRRFEDGTFDFLLSLIVLQHIENRYKQKYLAEFVRVLAPAGVAMITVPSHPRMSLWGMAYRVPNPLMNQYRKRRYGNRGVMELHGMRREDVEAAVREAGGRVIDVAPEPLAGTPWHSFRYVIVSAD